MSAHAIEHARISANKTQAEIAKAAEISANYYARIERGEVPGISLAIALRVAAALEIPVADLLP